MSYWERTLNCLTVNNVLLKKIMSRDSYPGSRQNSQDLPGRHRVDHLRQHEAGGVSKNAFAFFSCLKSDDFRHDKEGPEDIPCLFVLPERVRQGCLPSLYPGILIPLNSMGLEKLEEKTLKITGTYKYPEQTPTIRSVSSSIPLSRAGKADIVKRRCSHSPEG